MDGPTEEAVVGRWFCGAADAHDVAAAIWKADLTAGATEG
jgi:hypothetical protein